MYSSLINAIQNIHHLEDPLLELLLQKIEIYQYPARYKLINEGAVAKNIYWVEQGAIRSFY